MFRTFWPSWISVIFLEKLRDLRLGPMTLFQQPICVSIRLRWLYPFRTRQDRESALQRAPDADWTKMMGVSCGGSEWLEHLRKTSVFACGRFRGGLCSLTVGSSDD